MAIMRFGPFELDTETLEMRKGRQALPLRPQACRVLAMLVSRPGTLTTREELRRALWPTGVFVGYDTALNTLMKHLRKALGESADAPRYVQTLPGRGYRFCGVVTEVAPRRSAVRSLALLPFTLAGPAGDALGAGLVHAVVDRLTLRIGADRVIDLAVAERMGMAPTAEMLRQRGVDVLLRGDVVCTRRRGRVLLTAVALDDFSVRATAHVDVRLPAGPSAVCAAAMRLVAALEASFTGDASARSPHGFAGPVDDDVDRGQRPALFEPPDRDHPVRAGRHRRERDVLTH